jgi:hypothetical protein
VYSNASVVRDAVPSAAKFAARLLLISPMFPSPPAILAVLWCLYTPISIIPHTIQPNWLILYVGRCSNILLVHSRTAHELFALTWHMPGRLHPNQKA